MFTQQQICLKTTSCHSTQLRQTASLPYALFWTRVRESIIPTGLSSNSRTESLNLAYILAGNAGYRDRCTQAVRLCGQSHHWARSSLTNSAVPGTAKAVSKQNTQNKATHLQLPTKKFIYNREFHLSDMHLDFFFSFFIYFTNQQMQIKFTLLKARVPMQVIHVYIKSKRHPTWELMYKGKARISNL